MSTNAIYISYFSNADNVRTGNELTPSAKYDFKFKDYAPWVFRHLRMHFRLDPGDYLMSLTSKYILSELGSPGKSGSFFYFSRDYKYIIKTIHHGEHKLLRKILRDYYQHVQDNPNTLISQFYGLHRVKIPYGRKIHFVIMNNLFPPHRDIHQTFDLKGSTIGRDFKEEDLAANPRATLKDLNWLRRNLHLEFGPTKKEMFIAQMERDVKLLQRLKIMDYSLLVGIHDMGKGNEENLRGKTLRVFQPGGERQVEEPAMNMLTRTPSKLETARKARELRQIIKMEKPVPMGEAGRKMPEMTEERRDFAFYSDEGGFQATHEDDRAGEEIYYLGIIDCLTHVSFARLLILAGCLRLTVLLAIVRLRQESGNSVEGHVSLQITALADPSRSLWHSFHQIHHRHYNVSRSRCCPTARAITITGSRLAPHSNHNQHARFEFRCIYSCPGLGTGHAFSGEALHDARTCPSRPRQPRQCHGEGRATSPQIRAQRPLRGRHARADHQDRPQPQRRARRRPAGNYPAHR